jgi:hypothetical protein
LPNQRKNLNAEWVSFGGLTKGPLSQKPLEKPAVCSGLFIFLSVSVSWRRLPVPRSRAFYSFVVASERQIRGGLPI